MTFNFHPMNRPGKEVYKCIPYQNDTQETAIKRRSFLSIRSGLVGALGLFGLALLLPRPAAAIFGFGDIVFDPTSYATLGHIWGQDLSNYAKLIQSVQQLEKIYGNAVQVYDLSRAMSQSFSGGNKQQWIALAQTGLADYTHDKYGENQVWSEAVSGNPSQVPNAWQQSTVALNAGLNLAGQTVGQSPRISATCQHRGHGRILHKMSGNRVSVSR